MGYVVDAAQRSATFQNLAQRTAKVWISPDAVNTALRIGARLGLEAIKDAKTLDDLPERNASYWTILD